MITVQIKLIIVGACMYTGCAVSLQQWPHCDLLGYSEKYAVFDMFGRLSYHSFTLLYCADSLLVIP